MGWVVEQAGGKASTGAGAMLDQQVGPVVLISPIAHFVREGFMCVYTVSLEKLAAETIFYLSRAPSEGCRISLLAFYLAGALPSVIVSAHASTLVRTNIVAIGLSCILKGDPCANWTNVDPTCRRSRMLK